jgi:transposase-like protein
MENMEGSGVQRWTAKRRSALVVSLLRGETSLAEAARAHGLTIGEIEDWRDKFLLGAENALRSKPKDEEALKDEQIKRLKRPGASNSQWSCGPILLQYFIQSTPGHASIKDNKKKTRRTGRAPQESIVSICQN